MLNAKVPQKIGVSKTCAHSLGDVRHRLPPVVGCGVRGRDVSRLGVASPEARPTIHVLRIILRGSPLPARVPSTSQPARPGLLLYPDFPARRSPCGVIGGAVYDPHASGLAKYLLSPSPFRLSN